MWPLALAMLAAPEAPTLSPPVALEDAYLFGVRHEVANSIWRQARLQREKLEPAIWLNNDREMYSAWLDESAWRVRAWDLLDNSLNEGWPAHQRLGELAKLWRLLGPEMYTSGRMPTPSCNHR